jgi:hypothetical protein
MNDLGQFEKDILCGCVRRIAELERMIAAGVCSLGRDTIAINRRLALRDAEDGIVLCAPSEWVNGYLGSPAQRMQVSRAYGRLQARGLVRLVAAGAVGRVSHLRPTEAGKELAAKLLAEMGPVGAKPEATTDG